MIPTAHDYLDRIARVETKTDAVETWKLEPLVKQYGPHCRFCGKTTFKPSPLVEPADYWTFATLIPASLGAMPSTLNQVISCLGCRRSKANLDWLEWGRGMDTEALAAQRLKASTQACFNHLVKAKAERERMNKVRQALDSRWSHPRFVAYAWCSKDVAFIGFKQHLPKGLVSQVLCRALAPVDVIEGKAGVVYSYSPTDFLGVAWTLIEHNGYLKPVAPTKTCRDGTPVQRDLSEWQLVFPDIKTLRRGAYSNRQYLKPRLTSAGAGSTLFSICRHAPMTNQKLIKNRLPVANRGDKGVTS